MNARLASIAAGLFIVASPPAPAQGTTERVSIETFGGQGNKDSGFVPPYWDIGSALSADATVVGFASEATNLVSGDTNGCQDIFVHERSTGITERVSVDSSGVQGNVDSRTPAISSDGMLVAFESFATNLVAGGTHVEGVFVRDRAAATTELVSVDSAGNEGNDWSSDASISSDGRYVAFTSAATNLVPHDLNGRFDVFVRDRTNGTTQRVSQKAGGAGGNDNSSTPSISADGRYVVFESLASNLVANDTNGVSDIFVNDLTTGVIERVSVDSSGVEGNDDSYGYRGPLISSDGSIVVFWSQASNLVPGAISSDVYLRDRSAGTTEAVSVSSSGVRGDGISFAPSISTDGKIVAFVSESSNLIDGRHVYPLDQIYVHDRNDATTEMVSVDSSGDDSDNGSENPSISADGQLVAFESTSDNLVSGDTNKFSDVFVYERCTVTSSWSNYGAGYPGTNGIPSLAPRSNPVYGQSLTLDVGNSSGNYAFGLLLLGFQQADLPTTWGGDLLVLPTFTLAIGLTPNGTSLTGVVPKDDRLCGLLVELQVLESDAGASKGISSTPGLELEIGR